MPPGSSTWKTFSPLGSRTTSSCCASTSRSSSSRYWKNGTPASSATSVAIGNLLQGWSPDGRCHSSPAPGGTEAGEDSCVHRYLLRYLQHPAHLRELRRHGGHLRVDQLRSDRGPSGSRPSSSHRLQSSSTPRNLSRPSAVTTQGRTVQGGLCRTCWPCPHSRSATQSSRSSW